MEVVALIVIGLFAGFVGGLLGVGGSIVMIPAMTELLGPDQHLYQAAAMIVNFFVVVPAVVQHRRARAIHAGTVRRLVPLAMLAVVVGVGVSEIPVFAGRGEAYLRAMFGAFLLLAAGADLYRVLRNSRPVSPTTVPSGTAMDTGWSRSMIVAIPVGFVAGLLGVGGGILAVPLQRRVLGISIRVAIANSATIIIATSLVGAMVKNYAYLQDHPGSLRPFLLALVLIPTAIVGSLYGSSLTHRLPLRVVKAAFFVLLSVAAVRLVQGAARDLRHTEVASDAHFRAGSAPTRKSCPLAVPEALRRVQLFC